MSLPGKPKRRKFERHKCMLEDDQHNQTEQPAKPCSTDVTATHSPSSSLPHLSPQLSPLWPFPTYSKGPADRFSELSSFVQSCSHLELVHLTAEILPLLKRDFLAHLPYEIVQKILRYLAPKDLLQCAKVSRAWRHVSEDTLLWQAHCQGLQGLSELGNDPGSNCRPFERNSVAGLSCPVASSDTKRSVRSLSPPTPHSVPWKKLFLREKHVECNWRHGVVAKPKVLYGHHNHVITCLEVYKDWAISGSDDSSICVWDLITGDHLTSLFGHIGGVWSMIVLPPPTAAAAEEENGTDSLERVPLLVSGSTDRTARIWRLDNHSWACVATLFGHHSTVRCLASKQRGRRQQPVSSPRKRRSCDTAGASTSPHCRQLHQSHEACQQHLSLRRHEGSDSEAEEEQVLKATDRLFVSGSRDTTLRLWNARTGQCVLVLRGHRGAVRCVQFCGLHVVSGSYDCTVRVWCAVSGACLRVLRHHADRVYTLLFDGLRVISGSLDTQIRVWNISTGDLEQTFTGHQSLTSEMALDVEQGRLISSNADETIRAWNISTGECVHILAGVNKHQSAVTCVQMTHNFIVSSSDDGTVKLWNRETGDYLRDLLRLDTFGSGGVVWRIIASPTRLVCAAGSRCGSEATKLVVFDFGEPISSEHRCQTQHLISPPLCLSQLLSSNFGSIDCGDSHRQRRLSSGTNLSDEIKVAEEEPRDQTRRRAPIGCRNTATSPRFDSPPPHLSPSP